MRSVGQPYLLPASECSLVSADRTNIKAKVTATHGLWLGAAAIDSAPVTHAVLRLRHRFSAPSVSALQAGSRNGGPAAWIGCEAERSRLTDRSDAAVRDFAVPCRAAPAIDPLRSCGPVPDVAHFALARKLVIARLQDDPIADARQKFHP